MYKMDEPDYPRMDVAWENNGGKAGWNKLSQGRPISELENQQNRMKLDMDDFMREKNERISAALKPKANPMADAVNSTPIESLNQYRKKDTFDFDPTTSGMYDDGHVYTDKAGSMKWKFVPAQPKEATAEAPALSQ